MKKVITTSGIIIVLSVISAFLIWDKLKKDFDDFEFDLDEDEDEDGL